MLWWRWILCHTSWLAQASHLWQARRNAKTRTKINHEEYLVVMFLQGFFSLAYGALLWTLAAYPAASHWGDGIRDPVRGVCVCIVAQIRRVTSQIAGPEETSLPSRWIKGGSNCLGCNCFKPLPITIDSDAVTNLLGEERRDKRYRSIPSTLESVAWKRQSCAVGTC